MNTIIDIIKIAGGMFLISFIIFTSAICAIYTANILLKTIGL
jgi:hypothetical protein